MANLRNAQPVTAQPVTQMQGSIVTNTDGSLGLSVNGNVIPYRCVDPITVLSGDTVVVQFVQQGAAGGAEAWVVGRLGNVFRPSAGTVITVPPSSPTITVTGTDGTNYTATFLGSYTPAVNDIVDLWWPNGYPVVLGKAGTVAAPPPPPPPATVSQPPPPPVKPRPRPPQTGSTPFAATDSGSWNASFGWDTFAQENKQVYTGGAAYGGPCTGAWFYNNSPKILAGRTITAIYFEIGARLWVGNYNQPVTIHVYCHTSPRKPGGNVSLGASFAVTLKSGAPRTTFAVPSGVRSAFASALLAGGGFAIFGEPYAGFNGRNVDPQSGTFRMYWSR